MNKWKMWYIPIAPSKGFCILKLNSFYFLDNSILSELLLETAATKLNCFPSSLFAYYTIQEEIWKEYSQNIVILLLFHCCSFILQVLWAEEREGQWF